MKALKKVGFVVVRQKGSHIRLEKVGMQETINITVPNHKQLKKNTLNRILKNL
ncbi:MAG: type II toxin-antitoxin system HicA family toxin [Methanosarcinales archaeon]